MVQGAFKSCPYCGKVWPTREDFIADDSVESIGYQVNYFELQAGLFFFTHSCKGTMAIPAGEFADLHEGPVFKQRLTHTKKCPAHCQRQDSLKPCPKQCECAYVRAVLQKVS